MAESYNIIFNSKKATNRSGTAPCAYTYSTRWSTVIPNELRSHKFNLTWTLQSELNNVDAALVGIYVNLGASPAVVDQSCNTSLLLGAISPTTIWNGTDFWYQYRSGAADNCPITTSYPNQDLVTVTINDADDLLQSSFPEYYLVLSFTPIDN